MSEIGLRIENPKELLWDLVVTEVKNRISEIGYDVIRDTCFIATVELPSQLKIYWYPAHAYLNSNMGISFRESLIEYLHELYPDFEVRFESYLGTEFLMFSIRRISGHPNFTEQEIKLAQTIFRRMESGDLRGYDYSSRQDDLTPQGKSYQLVWGEWGKNPRRNQNPVQSLRVASCFVRVCMDNDFMVQMNEPLLHYPCLALKLMKVYGHNYKFDQGDTDSFEVAIP